MQHYLRVDMDRFEDTSLVKRCEAKLAVAKYVQIHVELVHTFDVDIKRSKNLF